MSWLSPDFIVDNGEEIGPQIVEPPWEWGSARSVPMAIDRHGQILKRSDAIN